MQINSKVKDIDFVDCKNGVVISLTPFIVDFGKNNLKIKYTLSEVKKYLRIIE